MDINIVFEEIENKLKICLFDLSILESDDEETVLLKNKIVESLRYSLNNTVECSKLSDKFKSNLISNNENVQEDVVSNDEDSHVLENIVPDTIENNSNDQVLESVSSEVETQTESTSDNTDDTASNDQVLESVSSEVETQTESTLDNADDTASNDQVLESVNNEVEAQTESTSDNTEDTKDESLEKVNDEIRYSFSKKDDNDPRAILVSQVQFNKLIKSCHTQIESFEVDSFFKKENDISVNNDGIVSDESSESLTKKAIELYKQGKVDEAQKIMDQINSMNH